MVVIHTRALVQTSSCSQQKGPTLTFPQLWGQGQHSAHGGGPTTRPEEGNTFPEDRALLSSPSVISEEGSHASEENWKSDTETDPVRESLHNGSPLHEVTQDRSAGTQNKNKAQQGNIILRGLQLHIVWFAGYSEGMWCNMNLLRPAEYL